MTDMPRYKTKYELPMILFENIYVCVSVCVKVNIYLVIWCHIEPHDLVC